MMDHEFQMPRWEDLGVKEGRVMGWDLVIYRVTLG